MYAMTILRTAFMACVPLFCILSGYLLEGKKLQRGYYRGIKKTLITYLLASGANLIWRIWFLKENLSFRQSMLGILNFTAAPYGWYIEMYIGLFLLAPFLNILYHNLPEKKHKHGLLITLIALTALPSVVNIYDFTTRGGIAIGGNYTKLIPAWWAGIWPITYYFLGMYLKEFGLKMKPMYNLLLYFGSVVLFGLFNIYCSYGSAFIWGDWQGWGALPNVIMTALLFNLLSQIKNVRSEWAARSLKCLSSLCLGAYLVSYIFDTAFYPKLIQYVPDVKDRLSYYPLITVLVFICSMLLSFMLKMLQQALYALCVRVSRSASG